MPTPSMRHLATALAAALLLLACNKDEKGDVVGTNGVPLSGDVILKILDANTRLPVDGAEISLVGGASGFTKFDGQVTLKGVRSGAYFVRVEREGYEPSESMLDAAVKGELTPVPLILSKSIPLYRRGVKVRGRILVKRDAKTAQQNAKGVTVELRLSGAFQEPLKTDVTDDEGVFAFDDLPELTASTVRTAEFTLDGKTYRLGESSATHSGLYAGESQTVPVAILTPVTRGMLQVLTASPAVLEKGKPLRIELSGKVDTSTLTSSSILLRLNSTTLAAALEWDDDFRVLEVTPYQSDWGKGTYSLALSSMSDVEGNPINSSLGGVVTLTASLSADDVPVGKLENLALRSSLYLPSQGRTVDTGVVDYYTTNYRLSWNEAEGATHYEIFTREGSDSAWRLTSSSVIDTQATLTFSTPLNGKILARQHMVVPRGLKFAPGFEDAASLEVKDGVKPVLTGSGSSLSSAFYNLTGATAKTVNVTFSLSSPSGTLEPLDTSKVPEVTVREGCRSAVSSCDSTYAPKPLRFRWTSRTAGIAEFEVDAGKDGRQDSLLVDFSDVTDLAGNASEGSNGGAPVIRYLPF